MSDSVQNPSSEDFEARVIRVIADCSGTSESRIKLTDRIDADLLIADEDMDELFGKVIEEFGTDFSGIEPYYGYYRHGMWVPGPLDPGEDFLKLLGASFAVVFASIVWRWLRQQLPWLHLWWLIPAFIAVLVLVWRIRSKRRARRYEPSTLQMTVGDVVDAVRAGKWIPPKDIDEQICRLGQRRSTI